jgi:NAD+ kinase
VEESSSKEEPQLRSHKNGATNRHKVEDKDDSEEEEEKFDIDDLSSDSDAAPAAGDGGDSGVGSSPSTSPSAAAAHAAEAIMGMSPTAHAKARVRSRSRSGIRSGVDSPSRYAAAPPRHSTGQGHVHWATSVPGNIANNVSSPTDGGMGDMATPTAVHGRRMRSRSPGHIYSPQHPRAFAVWGQDESDSNSSDADPSS